MCVAVCISLVVMRNEGLEDFSVVDWWSVCVHLRH